LAYPGLSSRENEGSLLRENPLDSQNNKIGNASLGPHTVPSIIANAEHCKMNFLLQQSDDAECTRSVGVQSPC
jgi:hypothetical protein